MGHLSFTRRQGEQIRLTIRADCPPEKLLKQLLRDGITLTVEVTRPGKARLGFDAPWGIRVDRAEWEGGKARMSFTSALAHAGLLMQSVKRPALSSDGWNRSNKLFMPAVEQVVSDTYTPHPTRACTDA